MDFQPALDHLPLPGLRVSGELSAAWWMDFGLSMLGVLAGLCALLCPRACRHRSILLSAEMLFLTLSTMLVLHFVSWIGNAGDGLASLGLPLGVVVGGQVVLCRLAAAPTQSGLARQPWALVCLGLCLGHWLAWHVQQSSTQNLQATAPAEADALFRNRRFPAGAIRTGPPDDTYVCHDWTFAGGPSDILDGYHSVADILRDYDYQPVDQPQVNDIIAYYSDGGQIVHTGVVRAIGDHGLILVESKWGSLGRYLHEPEVYGYSCRHAYYRSLRPGPQRGPVRGLVQP